MEFGHGFMVLVLQHKVTEKLRSSSESVRFRFEAGVFPNVSAPIVVCGGCESARFTFVKGLIGFTAGPWLVCRCFDCGRVRSVPGMWMVLKRRKMVCGGYVSDMKAYAIHLYLVCAWSVSVRSTFVAGVWRVHTSGKDEVTLLNHKGSSAVHQREHVRAMTNRCSILKQNEIWRMCHCS